MLVLVAANLLLGLASPLPPFRVGSHRSKVRTEVECIQVEVQGVRE
uniref:Uncharacterized protein n=1 Tax=Anguilla anguilla TaxID=7936 RepID=A0A0E9U224_ANGAN